MTVWARRQIRPIGPIRRISPRGALSRQGLSATPAAPACHLLQSEDTTMARRSFDEGCPEYNRLSRRKVLTAGVLGTTGLTLADLLRVEAAQAAPKREMSCILLWLRGGPSSLP